MTFYKNSYNHFHCNSRHYKKSQKYKTDPQTVNSAFQSGYRSPSSLQTSSTNFVNQKFNDSAVMLTTWRFSKDNATSKEDVTTRGIDWTRLPVLKLTFSGQGRVTSATAFCLFSRCHQDVNFIRFFTREKGKIISFTTCN